MNETALNYEYLIRRAFQCGRYGVPGANADTFRALERSFVICRDNTDPAHHDELLIKYAFDCGEVSTYINVAVEKFAKDFEPRFTVAENQEIEDIITLLIDSTIVEIEEAIQRAEILMIAYGRYPL
jgi:hypothetical protein